MNATADLSFVALVLNATPLAQAVMLLLMLLSLWSWWHIFQKGFEIRREQKESETFENEFWKGGNLNDLHERIQRKQANTSAMERIFEAGFLEYMKNKRAGHPSAAVLDATRRAMRASYRREQDIIEAHLNGLATIGSVSPYIGLFGTVWGIMNSFRGLSNVQQATLAAVAPGIAEALIATAIGLFAAIPAYVAYNRFISDADRLATRWETFMEEYSNILQRQA